MARKPASTSALPAKLKTRLRVKHLELFRQIGELQSLRKAADACGMTQPAATKLVQEMEDMFGLPLFHRDRRGMRLTDHGEVVRRHIHVVMADVANMYADVHLFAAGGTGLLRLGIIPSLSSELLARSVNELIAADHRARIQMRESSTDELLHLLAANSLDIIFGRVLHKANASNLRITKVYTESFEIVCAKSHRLARRGSIAWQELSEERWVLPEAGPLREMAEDMFTAHGVLRPLVAVASGSFHQTRRVIATGPLLGILPRSQALQGRMSGDLVIVRTGRATSFAPICLIGRRDIEQPPLVREFERIAVRMAKALRLS
jgi:DNA-binding transcriptional LysR family regulator